MLLRLLFVDGLATKRAAATLGISVSGVRKQIDRLREHLAVDIATAESPLAASFARRLAVRLESVQVSTVRESS